MRQETQGEMFEQKTSDNCSSDTVTIKLKQKDMVHRFVGFFPFILHFVMIQKMFLI